MILIGIEYDNFKSAYFSTFNNSIKDRFKELGYDDNNCDIVLNSIRDFYEYIYIPVEESPQELLKLQNNTMQKMLNKDILAEIEKALNKKTKSMSVVTQITSNLDAFVNEITLMAENVYASEVYDNAGKKITEDDGVATSFTVWVTPEEVESINTAVVYGGIQMYLKNE